MKPDVRVLGGRCSRMGLRTRCFIYEASLWYPSLPVFRRELAGAATIRIVAWGGGEAPMLISREALRIFVYRDFAYLFLVKYAFLF